MPDSEVISGELLDSMINSSAPLKSLNDHVFSTLLPNLLKMVEPMINRDVHPDKENDVVNVVLIPVMESLYYSIVQDKDTANFGAIMDLLASANGVGKVTPKCACVRCSIVNMFNNDEDLHMHKNGIAQAVLEDLKPILESINGLAITSAEDLNEFVKSWDKENNILNLPDTPEPDEIS